MPTDQRFVYIIVAVVFFLLLVSIRRRREAILHRVRRGIVVEGIYVGVAYVMVQAGRTTIEALVKLNPASASWITTTFVLGYANCTPGVALDNASVNIKSPVTCGSSVIGTRMALSTWPGVKLSVPVVTV